MAWSEGNASFKVLHIIPSIGPLRGGPSIAVRTMAEGLASQGIAVDVVTTDDNGPQRLAVPLGKPILHNGVNYWHFRRHIKFYTISWSLFKWLLLNLRKYDVVHIHGLFSFAATAGALCAAYYDVPYVVRPLGVLNAWGIRNRRPFLKKLSLNLIERRIISRAAAVQFTSEQEKCEAEIVGGCAQGVVIPIPVAAFKVDRNSKDELIRLKYPELAGKTILLFLSRLDPIKGLNLLFDGLAKIRLAQPNVALLVAGTGEESFVTRLRKQTERLGIQEHVIWTGFIEGHDKHDALAVADMFILPSYSENFGMAVVEAMASGLPVVVSDRVGIHREIEEAEAGVVVRCDSDSISRAVINLLENHEERTQKARNALLLAERFSSPAVCRALVGLYNNLDTRRSLPICAASVSDYSDS